MVKYMDTQGCAFGCLLSPKLLFGSVFEDNWTWEGRQVSQKGRIRVLLLLDTYDKARKSKRPSCQTDSLAEPPFCSGSGTSLLCDCQALLIVPSQGVFFAVAACLFQCFESESHSILWASLEPIM